MVRIKFRGKDGGGRGLWMLNNNLDERKRLLGPETSEDGNGVFSI